MRLGDNESSASQISHALQANGIAGVIAERAKYSSYSLSGINTSIKCKSRMTTIKGIVRLNMKASFSFPNKTKPWVGSIMPFDMAAQHASARPALTHTSKEQMRRSQYD